MPRRIALILMLGPALAVLGLLFYGALAAGLVRSFGVIPAAGQTEPSLEAWHSVLTSQDVWAGFGVSLYVATVSTLLAMLLGVGAALLLRRLSPRRRSVRVLFQLNLAVPHLVGALGIFYLFAQSGSFARLATATGLIDRPADFPALVFDPYAVGIILTYVWKEVPFVGLVVLASLQTAGDGYEAAARTLGATRWQSFRHVLLPLILPGTLAAGVVVFAFAFGAYEVPLLLGRSYPEALPVLGYRLYTDVDLGVRPQAMAVAMLIAFTGAGLVLLQLHLLRRAVRP